VAGREYGLSATLAYLFRGQRRVGAEAASSGGIFGRGERGRVAEVLIRDAMSFLMGYKKDTKYQAIISVSSQRGHGPKRKGLLFKRDRREEKIEKERWLLIYSHVGVANVGTVSRYHNMCQRH